MITVDVNTLKPKQNGHHFADNIFKYTLIKKVRILIKISLKLFSSGQFNNKPAVIEIIAWCLTGIKPLFEPILF